MTPRDTLERLAEDLNRCFRRHCGLTGYVYRSNEETDVAAMRLALIEMGDSIGERLRAAKEAKE